MAFNVLFGQYKWNVMLFGFKNAPAEFQKVINHIFNPYINFIIVYVLVYSNSLGQHFKHLMQFHKIIKNNGIVLSKQKMNLVQVKIKYLGYEIENDYIRPI